MVVSWIPIILIVFGILWLILFGILGWNWLRNKWIYDKFGPTVARIVAIVIGFMIIIMGIFGFYNGW